MLRNGTMHTSMMMVSFSQFLVLSDLFTGVGIFVTTDVLCSSKALLCVYLIIISMWPFV